MTDEPIPNQPAEPPGDAPQSRDAPQIYVVDVPRLYASSPNIVGFEPNSQGKYGFENVSKR